ncbi:MAG: aminotransferase class III-fold pyridoxal phosphate-dependent enzyme [Actinomycetota bacterium]|nr:aminotransferase class III-fold pyridoxal phosphate-dependent enzyme [Actinomycetota bacterium]
MQDTNRVEDHSKPGGGASAVPNLLHPWARPAASSDSFVNIVGGSGSEVVDSEGRTYFDALASLWYCNIGHGRQEVARAVADQMSTLEAFHLFDRFTNPVADELADRLAALAPAEGMRVFMTTGGSEAVETALKLARFAHASAGHPERTIIVSRQPSYHGVTYGAMAATGLPPNKEGFGQQLADVVQVPHDDLDALDRFGQEHGDRIAAVISEPVVGAGGVYPPADGYLQGLRERCDRWGAFLVLDEVICGFGRMGSWWGSQHYGVRPDMTTFAKGVTSGYMPVGGVLVGPAVRGPLEADPATMLRHGNTYAGHPTACAAALANLDIIEAEGLISRADTIASVLGKGLSTLVDGELVTEVRGDAGVWALGFSPRLDAVAVRNSLLSVGAIARPIGASTLAFCPPLVSTEEQLSRCVEMAGEAIGSLAAGS